MHVATEYLQELLYVECSRKLYFEKSNTKDSHTCHTQRLDSSRVQRRSLLGYCLIRMGVIWM